MMLTERADRHQRRRQLASVWVALAAENLVLYDDDVKFHHIVAHAISR